MLTVYNAGAQGENNIWAFGIGAGLDFSSGKPEFFQSRSNTAEGCATVCNSAGDLLFYSDGSNVWNRNHEIMDGGSGILGNHGGSANRGSATQGVAIIPFLFDTDKYYMFTVDCTENVYAPILPGYLRYSLIDMSLNNGLGGVVTKNIVLDQGASEKMVVVKGDDCYLWLLVHMHSSSEFRAYKIDEEGKIHPPVSSFVSTYSDEFIAADNKMYMVAEMKVSSDSRLIALSTGRMLQTGGGSIEVFAFNNRTGEVSSPARIYEAKTFLYGLSFSPDNKLLYVGPGEGIGATGQLLQFDLSPFPSADLIGKSVLQVGSGRNMAGMRIGPDGKIYIAPQNDSIIRCINNPNVRGKDCDLTTLSYTLPDTVLLMLGFGSHVYAPNDVRLQPVYTSSDTFLCRNEPGILLSAPEGYKQYIWNDGVTTRERVISGFKIWVRSEKDCGMQVDTFTTFSCNQCMFIPNAFTPNNDGLNDRFRAVGNDIEAYEIFIYNRFGNLVYTSKDRQQGWNGMHGAILGDVGVYMYYVKGRCRGGVDFMLKGDVTLIR